MRRPSCVRAGITAFDFVSPLGASSRIIFLMRQEACSKCQVRFPVNSLYEVNQKTCCEQCGDGVCVQLQQDNLPIDVRRKVDPSICVKCGADAGVGEFEVRAGGPHCPACLELLYHRKFPFWLSGSLVAMLMLLAASLMHSSRFFISAPHPAILSSSLFHAARLRRLE